MTRTLSALLCGLVLAPSLFAQKPPYDVFPPADPPYYRVRYEASAKPGGLALPVNYTAWVPTGVATLRGVVVHQHGCGEGSCKSGLTGAYDLHWQALARKHGCALLSPAYEQPEKADCQLWCDPRNGSDAAFRKALADLGAKTGHPELATVPWALWGHSGGGHWAGGMVLLHPDRVAAAWLRSGVPLLTADPQRPGIKAHALPDAALAVPVMCNLGTKEGVTVKGDRFAGVWPANEAFFNQLRGKCGLVGVAVDPLTSHECGNQRYLAIPWLDACLTARLPKAAGDPLRPMPAAAAWLAKPLGDEAVPAAKYNGDPLKAAWLPGKAVAKAWARYVKDTEVADTTPPPAPTNLRVTGAVLTWDAEADLESGLARFVVERDGTVLADVPGPAKNPFGRPVFQGLQYSDTPVQPLAAMRFTDATAEPGKRHAYRVIAVNTAGLKSAPSADAVRGKEPVALFDGTDTAMWYTFLRDHGKDKDPDGAFAVRDRVLRVSGREWGGLVTRDEYSDYELRAEYAWGTKTWPPREKTARDSGLILHSTGPDGAVGKSWLAGIQCNMLEGATGDVTITGSDKRYAFKAQAEERPAGDKTGFYWKDGAPERAFAPGSRLMWSGRDPAWENRLGFRGKNDVEKPVGEWNELVVTMKGDTMTVRLNGVTVSRATGLGVTRGKIQIQSEGAEVLFRKITLTPLD